MRVGAHVLDVVRAVISTAPLFHLYNSPSIANTGNCQLVLAEKLGTYHRLGAALDDAPGEAYDKVSLFFCHVCIFLFWRRVLEVGGIVDQVEKCMWWWIAGACCTLT